MSKTIDEKVVEMKFDNKQFETNVQTSLSTLDKLKAKLNLTGASKGLEDVNKATKSLDFSQMESSLAAIEKRFSTMGIVGMTVIQNLTNSVIGMMYKLKNYSIDRIIGGGYTRASKIENARFQLKGLMSNLKDVEDVMKDVDFGVTDTAYGLDAAATVAAQLAASGMKAGDSMRYALRGISGVAAMTNSSYEDIGRIYTSVAGNGRLMGDQLLQLSVRGMNAAAVLGKAMNKSEADIRKMVSKGQISFDDFSKAMYDAFGEHAVKANDTLNGVTANIGSAFARIGELFYKPIIAENSPLIKFLQSFKDRVNEIKQTVIPIASEVTTVINNMFKKIDNWFNSHNILGYSPFKNLEKAVTTVTKPINDVTKAMNKVTKSTKDYEKVVNEIIMGKWKNAPTRWQALTKAGYDWAYAQNMVNKKLGSTVRHTTKFKPAADNASKSTKEMTKETNKLVAKMANLSDAELKAQGYTKDQIKAFRTLRSVSDMTGLSVEKLIELINTKDSKGRSSFNTRFLILNSIKNVLLSIVGILKPLGKAFGDVFNIKADGLFSIIAGFHKITEITKNFIENNADKLQRTFRGLFSILHIIGSFITTGLRIALMFLGGLMGDTNVNVLDLTANLGDAIHNFDKWITSNGRMFEVFNKIGNVIRNIVMGIAGYIQIAVEWVKNNEKIMSIINKLRTALENTKGAIGAWFKGLRETDNIPKYIFEGLANGLKKGAVKIYDIISKVAETLITTFKVILGIASPSKVFFAIGVFLMTGLIRGMQDGSIDLFGTARDIVQQIIDIFKGFDFGNIIAIGITGGLVGIVNKIIGIFHQLLTPLNGLRDMLSGLGDMFESFGLAAEDFAKSKKWNSISNIIKSVGITIALLAGSLWLLAKLPADQLKQGGIALGVMTGILLIFLFAVTKMAKSLNNVQIPEMKTVLASVLGIAASMYIMSSALKKLAKIEPDRMISAIAGLVACAFAMGVLLVVLGDISKNFKGTRNVEKLGKVYTKIAASMLLVAIALKIISGVDANGMKKAGIVFAGMVALLVIVSKLNKWSPNSMIKSAETIKAVGIAMLLLVIATKLAGMLKPKDFLKAIGVIGLFSILLIAIMGISKMFRKTEMIKVGASILFIVGAIGLLALITQLLSNMKEEQFRKGVKCVSILGLIVMGLIAVSKNSNSGHALTLIGVAGLILTMGVIAWLLGKIETKNLIKGVAAVGALSYFVSILLKATKDFNPGEKAIGTMIVMIVMLVMLAGAMVGLSFIEPKKLLSASTALGEVILSLAAVTYAIGKMKVNKGVIGTLFILTGIITILVGVVALLTLIPNIERAIYGATGIAILAGALTLMAIGLSKIDGRKKLNYKFVAGLYALIPLLIGIAGALLIAGNAKNAVKNAVALSILLVAMSGVLAAVSLIGQFLKGGLVAGILGLLSITVVLIAVSAVLSKMDKLENAIKSAMALSLLLGAMSVALAIVSLVGNMVAGVIVGVVGLLALTGILFGLVQVLANMQNIQNAIPNALALSILLEAMSNALFKLSIVAPLALIANVALAGLLAVILAFGVVATAIGALMTKFPQLEQFLDKGLPILEKIAAGIGKAFGALIANFMGKIADELPHTGKKLTEFMVNAMPFIILVRKVDDKVLNGVGILAKSILALSGANMIEAITKWISGGQSFERLGSMLSSFAVGAQPFIKMISKVKPEAMEGAKNLAQAVLAFTAGNFMEQLSGKIFGEGDPVDFGEKLGTLAKGLSSFVKNLKGFDQKNLGTIEVACEGIKKLTEAAKDMPKDGGLWQKLVGSVNIEDFGDKLPALADGLVGFCSSLEKGKFSADKQGLINTACDVIKKFTELAQLMPDDGGLWGKIVGKKEDIKSFADKFPDVGTGVAKFVNNLSNEGGLSNDSVELARTAVNIMYAISSLARLDLDSVSGKFGNFGDKLVIFAQKLSEFINGLKDVGKDELKEASDKMDEIVTLASKLMKVDSKTTKSFKDFSDKLKTFGLDAVKEFIKSLKNVELKTQADDAIKTLIDSLKTVISSYKGPFNEEGVALVGEAVKGLQDSNAIEKAKQAGRDFGQGFINGIQSKKSDANTMANGLGTFANRGLQTGIDSNSPSKITHKLGNFFGEGFIIGIKEYNNKVYSQSSDMAERAKDGLSRAIAGVSNLIADGIDDDITIRPILDLSDVQAGAASINGMFASPSIGVMSNLNAISSGMRSYRQNGGENVVDAIDRLSKNLGNTNGDTYHIDGITYDDGSNVASAVQTLIRAAKIERRK